MVLPVSSSPAAVPVQGRSYTKPIIVLLGLAAIAALLLYVARSLRGRTTILPDPATLLNQGIGFLKEERFDEAVGKFTSALGCNPADPLLKAQTLFRRGIAYASLSKYEKALDDLTKALEGSFQNQELRAYLFKVRGDVYFAQDEFVMALENYKQGLACDLPLGFEVEFLVTRTDVYLRQKEFALALAATTEVLAIDSLDPAIRGAVYLQRGNAQMGLGDYKEAIENFNTALQSIPHDVPSVMVLYQRAFAHTALEEFELAIDDLTMALEIPQDKKSQAELFYLRGCARSSLQRYQKAIEDFNAACSLLDHPLFYIRIERALAYIGNDTPDLAIEDMTQALGLESSSENQVIILLVLGRAYAKQNNSVKAIENYTAGLKLDPVDQDKKAELLYFRGIARQLQNQLEKARVDWQAALNCEPSDENLKKAIEARLAVIPAAT